MSKIAKELDSESNSCLRKLTAAIELQAALELYQVGRLVEASAALEKLLAVDPEIDQVVLPLLGLAHFKLGQHGLAVAVMERALKLFDESPSADQDESRAETLLNLGCAYVKLGQFAKALETLSRVLEQNPKNAFAYYNCACAYGRIGDVNRCVQSLQSAIDHDRKFLKRIASEDAFDAVRGSDSFLELVAKNTKRK